MPVDRRKFLQTTGVAAAAIAATPAAARAAQSRGAAAAPTASRAPEEGKGPFRKLVIRGVNLIPGDGSGPRGPVDVVVSRDRISAIIAAGAPGKPLRPRRPPFDADHEIDATGMWLMPGLVDEHVHSGQGGTPRPYAYKLWVGHGVSTVRGVALSGNDARVAD